MAAERLLPPTRSAPPSQVSAVQGDLIQLPHTTHRVRLLRHAAPVLLRQWRQDFVRLCERHPLGSAELIGDKFAAFLDGKLTA